MTSRTGLALPLNLALPVRRYAEMARDAENAGYTRVWAAEAGNNDAFGLLTACALATGWVEFATGVLPIFTRTPALMAQCAATLQDASDGRFSLGIGVSSPIVVERWNGVRYDRPLERIREYARVVTAILAGDKVTRASALYPVDGYRLLMHVPKPPPPILVGALNPGMLRAAGEVSGGALLNWIGAPAVPAALEHVRDGAAGAPRTNAVFVRVCVTDDVEAARRWARREVMGYVIVPAYRRAFDTQGWADETAVAMEHWGRGDRKSAAASLPDAFVDSLCHAGDEDTVRERFAAYRGTGVDEPIAFLFSGQTDPDLVRRELEATTRALAPGSSE